MWPVWSSGGCSLQDPVLGDRNGKTRGLKQACVKCLAGAPGQQQITLSGRTDCLLVLGPPFLSFPTFTLSLTLSRHTHHTYPQLYYKLPPSPNCCWTLHPTSPVRAGADSGLVTTPSPGLTHGAWHKDMLRAHLCA